MHRVGVPVDGGPFCYYDHAQAARVAQEELARLGGPLPSCMRLAEALIRGGSVPRKCEEASWRIRRKRWLRRKKWTPPEDACGAPYFPKHPALMRLDLDVRRAWHRCRYSWVDDLDVEVVIFGTQLPGMSEPSIGGARVESRLETYHDRIVALDRHVRIVRIEVSMRWSVLRSLGMTVVDRHLVLELLDPGPPPIVLAADEERPGGTLLTRIARVVETPLGRRLSWIHSPEDERG